MRRARFQVQLALRQVESSHASFERASREASMVALDFGFDRYPDRFTVAAW